MATRKYPITFIRYTPPHGTRSYEIWNTEDADVYAKAMQIVDAGFHFEVELLATGHTSRTIGDGNGDYAYAISPHDLPASCAKMIKDFDIELAKVQSAVMADGNEDTEDD